MLCNGSDNRNFKKLVYVPWALESLGYMTTTTTTIASAHNTPQHFLSTYNVSGAKHINFPTTLHQCPCQKTVAHSKGITEESLVKGLFTLLNV